MRDGSRTTPPGDSPDEGAIEKLIRVTMLLKGDSAMRLRCDARAELRELQAEIRRLRDALNRERTYRESQEGLPEGALPRV